LKWLALMLAFVTALAVFAGCSGDSDVAEEPAGSSAVATEEPAPEPEEPAVSDLSGNIMIAAAASLENAISEEIIPLFNEQYPGITVTGNYGSSGKLQTQIEEGL